MQSMLFKIIEMKKKGGPNYRPLSVCEVRQGWKRSTLLKSQMRSTQPFLYISSVCVAASFRFFCTFIFNFLFWYDFTHMYSMHSEYVF